MKPISEKLVSEWSSRNEFDPNDINPKNQKTYGELYRKTLEKRSLITSAGYNLTFIWESDCKNKGEEQ